MKSPLRIAAATLAAITVAAGVALPANAADPDLYTTPGGHTTNGRLWNTNCEMYSSNVVRCRTEIWATQVNYSAGKYTQQTGWVFNNLTYLPSNRAAWKNNELGANGAVGGSVSWVAKDGRKWRTECDTKATGRGACRSYAMARVISATRGASGAWVFASQDKWVFNNLVLFAEGKNKPVTRIPANVLDQSRLTTAGFGPITLGLDIKDLARLGYVDNSAGIGCPGYTETKPLAERGLFLDILDGKLRQVTLMEPGPKTLSGAQVGMTYGQVKAIYGDRIQLETKTAHLSPIYSAVVRDGDRELVFLAKEFNKTKLTDSTRIAYIVASAVEKDWTHYSGC